MDAESKFTDIAVVSDVDRINMTECAGLSISAGDNFLHTDLIPILYDASR